MSAVAGRKAVLYWKLVGDTEWTVPSGVREKSFSLNNTRVDVTSDDDLGWKAALDDTSAVRDWSLKVSGVLKDDDLVALAFAETTIDVYYRIPGVFHVTGKVNLTSAEIPSGQEDPVTYDIAMEGSGVATIGNGAAPSA